MDPIQDQPTKFRIKVCIPERPRDYVPGSGPPLQPISLLPPKDSTAYILERIILPSSGLAADGTPLPRRMTYIVTWSDLPAAQMLVPAMDILDYVSPRELEEWEFKNTEEQMENEAIQKQQAQAGEAPKKRRGRPPKHSKIETAVVAPDEEETMVRGAMTIQTPAKDRLQDVACFAQRVYCQNPQKRLPRRILALASQLTLQLLTLQLFPIATFPPESNLHPTTLQSPVTCLSPGFVSS